jgi:O-antigen/teichoic acid export membrane protein
LLAWGLFTLGQCLGTHWYAAIPTLQGSGHAGAAFRALAVQRLTFGVTAGIGLLSMGRLEVLGIAQLAGACAGLLPASRLARSLQAWPSRSPGHPLRDAMLRSGGALWLSRLGGYLIVRANLPLASAALGLGPAGRLALTMQLMEALTQLSQAPMFAKLPKLYELRAHGALAASVAIVGRILLIGWLSFAAGSVVLLLFGADLLAMLGKPGALVATAPLALMLGGGLLELNFSMSATLLMVGNRVPFLVASLVSGLASLVLSLAALKFTNAGLLTVIAIPILVQAVYNYWKWPLECLRLFSTGYAALLRAALPSRP